MVSNCDIDVNKQLVPSLRCRKRPDLVSHFKTHVRAETEVSLKRSNVWCGTEAVVRARKLFILAPSGYRFSVVLDTNPDRFRRARVSGEPRV